MNWLRSTSIGWCLAALGTLAHAQVPQSPAASGSAQSEFVTRKGTHFYLHDKPYYFAGTNLWYGAYLGAPPPIGDRERLDKELDALKALGVTNLRVLAMSEASELKRAVRPAIMSKPGEFDEALLTGLDYLLAEMAKRDMKAVLYLNNFWQWSGGMAQYVSWLSGRPVIDPDVAGDWNGFMDYSADFYRLKPAQDLYREVIRTLVNRKNTFTGKTYRDDSTIMSWQLANEPRPGSDQNGPRNAEGWIRWIDGTAKYIHQIAPHHLVSTGNEGAMGSAGSYDLFVKAHDSPHVDYLTFHMWAPNWQWFDPKKPEETYDGAWKKAQEYLDRHIEIAQKLGKPIVLEEFGLNRDDGSFQRSSGTIYRDRFYHAVFELLEKRAATGAPIAGTNFWAWGGLSTESNADYMWKPGDAFMGDPPQEPQGLYSVFDSDASTLVIIRSHAAAMNRIGNEMRAK